MVWVLSLSDMDLSTHALTPGVPVIVFGVCQVLINSECLNMNQRSEGMGAKVHVREGNNPDHRLRSRNNG